MDDSKFQQARQYAIDLLQSQILPVFSYHNLEHTLAVVNACNRLADLEGIDEENRQLLLLAAHFHDTGLIAISSTDPEAFNAGRAVHEETAVQITKDILPEYGFAEQEIEVVARLIMATKWGHSPTDLLEQIISDADMSSIGRETEYFMRSSNALREELKAFGIESQDGEWFETQKELLETYAYHTASARQLFDDNRRANSAAVQSQLDQLYL